MNSDKIITDPENSSVKHDPANRAEINKHVEIVVDITIKLVALAALLIACYLIVEPFVALVVWASVLAISLYPPFLSLKKAFGGRGGAAATTITVLFLVLLIAPIVWMSISTGLSLEGLGHRVQSGELTIPPPYESVKNWPIIGGKVY